jgi:hypothetical protein
MWRNLPPKFADFFQKKENITTEYSFYNLIFLILAKLRSQKKKTLFQFGVPTWEAYLS